MSRRFRTRQAVLRLFEERPDRRMSFAEISAALEGDHPDPAGAVEQLVEDGELVEMGGGRYALPSTAGVHDGRFRARTSGGGVVYTDSGRLEVRGHDTAGALNGDRVRARRLTGRPGGDGRGVITEVLERVRSGISGILEKRGRGWRVRPLDPTVPGPLRASLQEGLSARPGQAVYADLVHNERGHTATVTRVLGDPSRPSVLVDAVVAEGQLRTEFPPRVMEEAEDSASAAVSSRGRTDLTDRFVITIDPADARDFDDAIDAEPDGEGGWVLRVHIADVAAYVPAGGALDLEARARGTSVYLPDRVLPMLPEALSNGACSLRPGEDRLARTVTMRFGPDGERKGLEVEPTVIRSSRRLTYEEADGLIRGEGDDGDLARHFAPALELSRVLRRRMDQRGALDIAGREFRVAWGPDGRPAGFQRQVQTESHRLIEVFMVEANRAVADFCGWSSLPVLYRVHPDPDEDAREKLEGRLRELGVRPPESMDLHPAQLSRLMDDYRGGPLEDLVSEAVLRSLRKAEYSPANDGHFGLALHSYMHFTSPIRRYPDLLVHQVLSALDAGQLPDVDSPGQLAADCSYAERRAELAERDSMELVALDFLSRRSGMAAEGVVTGVADFGCFVRLSGLPAEGLVPGRFLERAPAAFRHEGSPVNVVVESADPVQRRLTLLPE
ncbi:MAG: RNB domain-containing ribonuclease [Candidatus Fermentibacteraceae bacterium]